MKQRVNFPSKQNSDFCKQNEMDIKQKIAKRNKQMKNFRTKSILEYVWLTIHAGKLSSWVNHDETYRLKRSTIQAN